MLGCQIDPRALMQCYVYIYTVAHTLIRRCKCWSETKQKMPTEADHASLHIEALTADKIQPHQLFLLGLHLAQLNPIINSKLSRVMSFSRGGRGVRLESWGYTYATGSVGCCTQDMRRHRLDWKTSGSQTKEKGKASWHGTTWRRLLLLGLG